MSENADLRNTCVELKERVRKLELESDALEQYGRRNILRVSGIPEQNNEVTDDIIIQLASDLNVPISKKDIDRSHRVGKPDTGGRLGRTTKSTRQHRDIIVKFTSYNARHNLFQMRKELPTTENANLKSIFINEDLTKIRSQILFEARNFRRGRKLNAAYSSDGKILIRDLKDKRHIVTSLDDLVRFGYVKTIDVIESGGSGSTTRAEPQPQPSTSSVGGM